MVEKRFKDACQRSPVAGAEKCKKGFSVCLGIGCPEYKPYDDWFSVGEIKRKDITFTKEGKIAK